MARAMRRSLAMSSKLRKVATVFGGNIETTCHSVAFLWHYSTCLVANPRMTNSFFAIERPATHSLIGPKVASLTGPVYLLNVLQKLLSSGGTLGGRSNRGWRQCGFSSLAIRATLGERTPNSGTFLSCGDNGSGTSR